jgi:tetratricopeptide (TPR) repeat protein
MEVIIETLESKREKDCRVLEHLLSYAENQFGKGVTGKHYRERGDGSKRISNWSAELVFLNNILGSLTTDYSKNNSLSQIESDDLTFPCLEKSLKILNPWIINLDSDPSYDNLSKEQIDTLLNELFITEQNMACIALNRRQFDLAEKHLQRCLAYSKRYGLEGENKINMIFTALVSYCNLREGQGNYIDAVTFAEECYILVVEAYDCVHPQVQKAAGVLIHILIKKGDLYDAERYAQVTYGHLRDRKNGIDQDSEAVAEGAYNLASVIFQQEGDLIKAEELARESLRIRTLIYDSDHDSLDVSYGNICGLLATILRVQGKYGDETTRLYKRNVAILTRNYGPDAPKTAAGNYILGRCYHEFACTQEALVDVKQTQLVLAKAYYEESYRIYLKIYGSNHPEVVDSESQLAIVSNELSKFSLPQCKVKTITS